LASAGDACCRRSRRAAGKPGAGGGLAVAVLLALALALQVLRRSIVPPLPALPS
jgi:hypothetical protein